MNIHQLSVLYVDEQDRILVRAKTAEQEEFRLWLTRRMLQGFWPLLHQVLIRHVAVDDVLQFAGSNDLSRQMLSEFQRVQALEQTDFRTPYREEGVALPLGQEPLLVTEINITAIGEGRVRIQFSEKLQAAHASAGPRGFEMTLNPQLMHGFTHLLTQATVTSQWGGAAELPTQLNEEGQGAATLGNADKPKYLN